MRKRLVAIAVAITAVLLGVALVPSGAWADEVTDSAAQSDAELIAASENLDILLGVFFTSEEDVTDTVYASYGGSTFYAIDTAYRDATPDSTSSLEYMTNHSTHKCPGICYWNGYFWMISSWNRQNGRFHPMLSYSKDLKTWTHPEGTDFGADRSFEGILLDSLPDNNGYRFDVVSPKMHVASDGNLYITFCAGYFGGFHGALGIGDRMQVYTCKVTTLSATDGTEAEDGSGYLVPHITFETELAKKVTAVDVANDVNADIIDSNFYTEGDTTYLLLKRNGYTEEIYSSKTPNDPASWKAYNQRAAYGYEGVCIARANSTYYLFGDGVEPVERLGIRCVTSNTFSNEGEWADSLSTATEKLHTVNFISEDGNYMSARHGDVITLKAGTSEWRMAKSLLDAYGTQPVKDYQERPSDVAAKTVVTSDVYRLYNPYDYYRLYTTDWAEYQSLVSLGWNGEGVAWEAPLESSTAVYRLYNPYSGDHLWTTSTDEYDSLAAIGWQKEGTSFYSDDEHGVEVKRYFNPWITERGSTHHYTSDPTEQQTMVSNGWLWDGTGVSIYGVV